MRDDLWKRKRKRNKEDEDEEQREKEEEIFQESKKTPNLPVRVGGWRRKKNKE